MIRQAIQRFNEKNPGRHIQPMQLAQSVRMREKRIREVGRFAASE